MTECLRHKKSCATESDSWTLLSQGKPLRIAEIQVTFFFSLFIGDKIKGVFYYMLSCKEIIVYKKEQWKYVRDNH